MNLRGQKKPKQTLLLPPCVIRRTLPENNSEQVQPLVERELVTCCEEVREYIFKDCVVWAFPSIESQGRLVWKPSNNDVSINPRGPFSMRRLLGAFKYKRSPYSKCFLFITHHSAFSVYHWLCEALPRLLLLAERHGWDCPALLTEEASPIRQFQERSLQWLGFNGPVIRTSFTEGLRVKQLVTCDLLAPLGHHRPEFIRRIRERIRQAFAAEAREPDELVYISRSGARCRRTINEEEVSEALQAAGFKIVHLERLSPDDQVRATLNARLIAGNHGGGLPAMTYAPPGCRVVEIRSRSDSFNNCYYTLAHALGLEYHLLPAEPAYPEKGLDTDYHVDIRALSEAIRAALG